MKATFFSVSNGPDGPSDGNVQGVVTVMADGTATCTSGSDDFKSEYCQPVFNGESMVPMTDGDAWCRASQAYYSNCANFFVVVDDGSSSEGSSGGGSSGSGNSETSSSETTSGGGETTDDEKTNDDGK